MMQWLRNNPPPIMERRVVEPGATFSLFENHWKQATDVMESSKDAEGALTVISHLSQMISFLRVSRNELNTETSCKGFWLRNQCSEKVIKWLHSLQINGLQLPPDYEEKLVQVLHSLCEVASRDGELLGYESNKMDKDKQKQVEWDGAYSLASLLLEYSLRSDPSLGDMARYSFILLIQMASKFPPLEKSLTQESGRGLTNVVISGLTACFSQLPTFTNSTPEQLQAFIVQLKFVEEVTEAASDNVASTIAECFNDAFLLNVILPALTQSLHEEIAVVTNYLRIVCEHLTHPLLNRSIIQFVTSKLLPVLVQRLNHMSVAITTATLRLFTVLFEYYCEDFWHAVILRYLLPQNHLMVSQRDIRLPDIDFYDSSIRFLTLIPNSVIDALGTDNLTTHYVQYLNGESERLTNIDSMVSSLFFPQSKEIDRVDNESTNQVYPFWKYKYDGTDRLDGNAVERKRSIQSQDARLLEVQESEPTTVAESMTKPGKVDDPLQNPELNFTTVNLVQPSTPSDSDDSAQVPSTSRSGETNLEMTSLSVGGPINTNHSSSEGYASMEDNSPTTSEPLTSSQLASFGPFLDLLLVQLSNWENQNPEVSLVLSELVSVLASSRIPLLNTILLDPNLTLQPSYVTFLSLLKRIRDDLDFRMKDTCTPRVIIEVWQSMNSSGSGGKDPRRTSLTSPGHTPFGSPSSFVRDIKRMSGEGALASVFNSFLGRKSNSPSASGSILSTPSPRRPDQGHGYGQRPGNQQSEQSTEVAKTLAKRAIIFSHWLLELGAIAQQLSWKRK